MTSPNNVEEKDGYLLLDKNTETLNKPEQPHRKKTTKTSCLSKIDNFDKEASELIHNLEVSPWIEVFIYLMARMFNPDFVTAYFIIMFLNSIIRNGDYFFIIKPLLHVIISLVFTLILKKLINRPRPPLNQNIKKKFNCRSRETNCSMPSGDSLQSANFTVILICYYDFYYGFIFIPLVMFARVFYFCHFIMDTIVGTILGFGISIGMWYLLKNY